MGEGKGRIAWCDVYKGISILLVVLVHATYEYNPLLNQYAYQFLVTGFFFIAGYTAKGRDSRLWKEIGKKFYRMMVPYYVLHFAGLLIFWLMQKAGILSVVSTTQYSVGYGGALVRLLEGNNYIYCDWLGAMWFIPVLFLAEVIFLLFVHIFRNDLVTTIVSIMTFLGSDYLAGRWAGTGAYHYSIDLAGMAQVFVVAGYLMRNFRKREETVWQLLVKTFIIGTAWFGAVQAGFRFTFDWPSRDVNGPVDLVLPVFGILFTMHVSKLFSRSCVMKKAFVYLGQNSMGIMCFHFFGFKVAYLILILAGRMEGGEAYRLIPSPQMAGGWFLIFGMGVMVSLLVWSALNKPPALRFLLGGGEPAVFWGGIRKALQRFWKTLLRYWKALVLVAIFVLVCAYGVGIYRSSGKIEVDFPYEKGTVIFCGGWLPQGDTEDYRWFDRQASFQVLLTGQDRLQMQGHVAEEVEGISYLSLKMNGKEIYRETVTGGQFFEISEDISGEVRKYWYNTFEIETDGIRIPKEEGGDPRQFSAFISSIEIE